MCVFVVCVCVCCHAMMGKQGNYSVLVPMRAGFFFSFHQLKRKQFDKRQFSTNTRMCHVPDVVLFSSRSSEANLTD